MSINIISALVFLSGCVMPFNAPAAEIGKEEVSVSCAVAISISVVDFQRKEGAMDKSDEFDRIACIRRGGGIIEVIFKKGNPQVRGGGVYYEISEKDKKILKVRQSR